MYQTISKKPTKGADFELYRLNPHNISLTVPLSVDSSDIRFSSYRNGQPLSATVQPTCTVDGQKINASFSKEQMQHLPDSFDLVIEKGEEHLAICPVRISITSSRTTCNEAILQVGAETYISLIVSVSGVNGLSAYDIAVKNGYTGTEEEWILGLENKVTLAELLEIMQLADIPLYHGAGYIVNDPDPQLWNAGIDTWLSPFRVVDKMRGCLLLDDGTVNYYLDAYDWTKKEDGTPSDLTGAEGMVMVEIPSHYRKIEVGADGGEDYHQINISEYPLPGYEKIERFYYAAYESAYDYEQDKLSSVVNTTARYRGGDNTDDFFLGRPATGLDLPTARQAARKRGAGWELLGIKELDAVRFLYLLEYANRNSQAILGEGVYLPTSDMEGKQGPAAACGVTNSLGNLSGRIVIGEGFDVDSEKSVNIEAIRYRGIENIFGNTHELLDGVMSDYTAGERSGLFVATSPEYYSSYTPAEGGKWKKITPSQPFLFLPYGSISQITLEGGYLLPLVAGLGAPSGTYWSDYIFSDTTEPLSTIHPILHGGGMGGFNRDGIGLFFCMANTPNIFSILNLHIGSRIIYRPQ